MAGEGPKGTSKSVLLLASTVVCLQANSPYGDQSDRALAAIQWLESWRQREDLKLVFNRLVRIRMLGGVGGSRSNPGPIPIRWFVDFVRVESDDGIY